MTTKNDTTYYFEKAPVNKAIANFAVPMIIVMLVSIVYNLVDAFYIGLLGDYNLMAAVSLALPISTIFMGVGFLFGEGGGTYISRLLGEKRFSALKNVSSFSFYTPLVISLILSASGFIFSDSLLKLLGTSTATLAPTRTYASIIMAGGVVTTLSASLGQIIHSDGAAKQSMTGNIMGTALNIILDPIFLFVFKLGIAGIALATLISELVSTIYFVTYILRKSDSLSISLSDYKIDREILSEVFKIGWPVFLETFLMMAAGLVQNNMAALLGDVYVAIFGIVFRISMIPEFIAKGISGGIQPLIGYNYAAGNTSRTLSIMRRALLFAQAFCMAFTLAAILAGSPILNLFSHSAEVVSLGIPLLRAACLSFLMYSITNTFITFFRSVGQGIPAFVTSLAQGVFYIPIALFATQSIGVTGFAFSMPAADILTAMLSAGMYFFYRNKLCFKTAARVSLEEQI